jgi:DNA-binding transcriptional MocR family regulator
LLPQATTHEYLERGLFEGNLARTREALQIRRDTMLGALARELPAARWSTPAGGYFLWLELPEGIWTEHVAARAQAAGVTFVPGSDFFLGGGGEGALRLAYSLASPAEIDEGVTRLASAIGCSLRSAA